MNTDNKNEETEQCTIPSVEPNTYGEGFERRLK